MDSSPTAMLIMEIDGIIDYAWIGDRTSSSHEDSFKNYYKCIYLTHRHQSAYRWETIFHGAHRGKVPVLERCANQTNLAFASIEIHSYRVCVYADILSYPARRGTGDLKRALKIGTSVDSAICNSSSPRGMKLANCEVKDQYFLGLCWDDISVNQKFM